MSPSLYIPSAAGATGPQGPAGPTGPQGPTGAAGGTVVDIVTFSANFTFSSANAGKRHHPGAVGAIVGTIPTNAADPIPIGTYYDGARVGPGGLSFAGTGTASVDLTTAVTTFSDGVQIKSVFCYLEIAEIGAGWTLVKTATNFWYLEGYLR